MCKCLKNNENDIVDDQKGHFIIIVNAIQIKQNEWKSKDVWDRMWRGKKRTELKLEKTINQISINLNKKYVNVQKKKLKLQMKVKFVTIFLEVNKNLYKT